MILLMMMQIRYLGGNITQPIEISCGKMDVKSKKNLGKTKKKQEGSLIKLILAFFNFFFQKDSKKYYSPGAFVLTTL